MIKTAIWAIAIWAVGLLAAPSAFSHAVLLNTLPADQARSDDPPREVVLQFNEPVRSIRIRIVDGSGRAVASDSDVSAADTTVRVAIGSPLGPGTYLVSYRVTSADSHPVAGTFVFSVGPGAVDGTAAANVDERGTFWSVATPMARSLQLSGLAMGVGGILFLITFHRRDFIVWRKHRTTIDLAIRIAALLTALSIGLQGGVLLGGAPTTMEAWHVGVSSTRGVAAVVTILGLVALAVGLAKVARIWAFPLLGIGCAAVLAAFVLSGHAATARPTLIAQPALLTHIAIAMFWLGSLLPLLRQLDGTDLNPVLALRRFSRVAIVVVPVMLAAGAVIAVLQVGNVAALTGTAYGRILLIKVGLVTALAGVAGINRWKLLPALGPSSPRESLWLHYTIRAEVALGLGILAVTAVLSQTIPPRSMVDGIAHHDHVADSVSRGYAVVTFAGDYQMTVEVSPASVGQNAIAVYVVGPDYQPAEPKEIYLELSNLPAGIEPLRRRLVRAGPGVFRYDGSDLAIAGRWTVRLDALVDDFELIMARTEIQVSPR